MTFTSEQQEAFNSICQFFQSTDQVFILRGSAGTGKTTLLAALVEHMEQKGLPFHLMAPTGRAAHILHEKTSVEATTIHRGIYDFEKMEFVIDDEDYAKSNFKFHYPIRVCEEAAPIVIVDEGSMVGNRKNEGELWTFGTSQLLNDLISFAKLNNGGKLLIVGDPIQLPPVMEKESMALDDQYFRELGFRVLSYTLNEVLRQQADSIILQNATQLRENYKSGRFNELQLTFGDEQMRIPSSEVAPRYTCLHTTPKLGNSIVICYSNATANKYNEQIRQIYFPENANHVQEDDVLMVVTNHYARLNNEENLDLLSLHDIMNGEFIQLRHWSNEETHTVPVYENGERIHIPITFVDAEFLLRSGDVYHCKMITDPILSAPKGTVSLTLMRALYIDFCIRNTEIVSRRKTNPETFSSAIQSDPFINALRVRYGYAITCHKSQGGEWDDVFVDYDGVRYNQDGNRWMYTAQTRARKHLYMINYANITPAQDLRFNTITQSRHPHASFPQPQSSILVDSPFHNTDTPAFLKRKYCEVLLALEKTEYRIIAVQSLQYMERYSIASASGIVHRVDFGYNGRGIFRQPSTTHEALRSLLDTAEQDTLVYPPLEYEPSDNTMQYLFHLMIDACDTAEVEILKVIEDLEHYNVVYCLKTSSKYAWIVFNINNRGFITYASPYTENASDAKLQTLINTLSTPNY